MKTFIIYPVLIFIALLSSLSAMTEVPECLQEMIHPIPDGPVWYQYTRIDNYMYQGKMVYLATSRCCDRFNPLYDEECNYICAPSGGFRGSGDGKCKDFNETATPLGILWVALPPGK
jgi:hypothetical protein